MPGSVTKPRLCHSNFPSTSPLRLRPFRFLSLSLSCLLSLPLLFLFFESPSLARGFNSSASVSSSVIPLRPLRTLRSSPPAI
ncbi:hypothetical protein BO83DRAFT_24245 [Aspergillus eucalypticola CBS 122712]|uniref:Uncharacterized protein n=1 Tax=Aspergillus eucalypticola (strain CBS 122712 / IBT 29274) TaxID=1448314 RepID=A0A317VLM1_ASPEC|nr:uncharacterized protein BO83DRAFT_24245 [Aspergillus eucalypticola CBS 122712]PWY74027.1 hypothetical protein BO83DRAFT_24245 [Aspergillus eucalypticola CBS 122712]